MSEEQPSPSEPVQTEEGMHLDRFLESVSPGQVRTITTLIAAQGDYQGQPSRFRFGLPELILYCPSSVCNGERFFRTDDDERYLVIRPQTWNFEYLNYKCANCREQTKTFALAVRIQPEKHTVELTKADCYKFGELPPYGPPTPSQLISLLVHRFQIAESMDQATASIW